MGEFQAGVEFHLAVQKFYSVKDKFHLAVQERTRNFIQQVQNIILRLKNSIEHTNVHLAAEFHTAHKVFI